MAEWVKALDARDLSLIPGTHTHIVKEVKQLHKSASDFHVCTVMGTCTHINK